MEAVEAVLRSHFLEGRSKGLLPITASPNKEKRAPTTEKWALQGKIRNLLGHSSRGEGGGGRDKYPFQKNSCNCFKEDSYISVQYFVSFRMCSPVISPEPFPPTHNA